MAQAQIKPPGAWTYEDLFSLPDDGKRYEIIEGELYEMPSPTSLHAKVVMNLLAILMPIAARLRAELFTASLDVFVPGGTPVIPDILLILPDGPARVIRRGVEGPPDLVVEVLSPSNRGHDLLTKRALYGRAGVREYWLVDPDAGTFELLTLDGDVLRGSQSASGDDTVVSPLLDGAEIPLASVFAGLESIADDEE
jgi:Uma2 family endonuclease